MIPRPGRCPQHEKDARPGSPQRAFQHRKIQPVIGRHDDDGAIRQPTRLEGRQYHAHLVVDPSRAMIQLRDVEPGGLDVGQSVRQRHPVRLTDVLLGLERAVRVEQANVQKERLVRSVCQEVRRPVRRLLVESKRLVEIGVEHFVVADFLRAIIAADLFPWRLRWTVDVLNSGQRRVVTVVLLQPRTQRARIVVEAKSSALRVRQTEHAVAMGRRTGEQRRARR